MKQKMKANSYYSIKLNVERISIAILLGFVIIIMNIVSRQDAEIHQLKDEIAVQKGLSDNLESRLDELESKIDEIEGRVDDLESNSNY